MARWPIHNSSILCLIFLRKCFWNNGDYLNPQFALLSGTIIQLWLKLRGHQRPIAPEGSGDWGLHLPFAQNVGYSFGSLRQVDWEGALIDLGEQSDFAQGWRLGSYSGMIWPKWMRPTELVTVLASFLGKSLFRD